MAQIRQLPPHVADLIAAGEVVERPASVVKELVENAVDAGATAVVVEIRRGGMGMICVTDNGCGIAPEELPTAFLRHATSKLRAESDLAAIGTLGFRGEALAAIAAVSRLEICTCPAGALTGARLRLEGGVPGQVEETGAPAGTSITVRDLFYNTPARLKFMKKDSSETTAVVGLMQHLALSHPEVSFQLIKDGTEALHTPGDGKLHSAIYAALGRDFARDLVEVQGRGGEVSVRGFVTRPLAGRGSRGMQTFFVNGRFIKSQTLTAALEEGYRNQIMKGRFPGCVLHVELPAAAVDVNVHPAKTQVKFAREQEVFQAVYHTVKDALEQAGRPAASTAESGFFRRMDAASYRRDVMGEGTPAAAQGVSRSAVADRGTRRPAPSAAPADAGQSGMPRESAPLGQERAPRSAVPNRPGAPMPEISHGAAAYSAGRIVLPSAPPPWDTEIGGGKAVRDTDRPQVEYRREARTAPEGEKPPAVAGKLEQTMLDPGDAGDEAEQRPSPAQPQAAPPAHSREDGEGAEQEKKAPSQPETCQQEIRLPGPAAAGQIPWRIAGEVLKTYIVCEDGSGNVWLIDKHAAHERLNFDRMQAAMEPPMRQPLLTAVPAELSGEAAAALLEHLDLMERLGFVCEEFGGSTVLVREVPADIDAADTAAVVEEMAEHLRQGRDASERWQQMLHTMACKAAIKAGMDSSEEELRVIVDAVQTGQIQYCPHGRPVAVKLSRYELEKMFRRA